MTTIRPKKIVNTTREKPGPPVVLVKTKSVVGLEEKVQVSESKIDFENDSSEECSNDEQGRNIGLVTKSTPIDMIIGDKADMEKSCSAKMLELKAEFGEINMPEGHSDCSTRSAADNEKYFVKSKVLGNNFLFGPRKNQSEKFDVQRYRLGIKHRWPPPDYDWISFIFLLLKKMTDE